MVEFILKYWVDFLFGIIAAWAISKLKRFQELEQKHQKEVQIKLEEQIMDKVKKEIDDCINQSITGDNDLKSDMEILNINIDGIKKAILSMQGKEFRQTCKILLEPSHVITTEEYNQCIQDHDAYNGIGGNHQGDLLFDAVRRKYNASVSDDK